MPVTRTAKRALHRARRRQVINLRRKRLLKRALKQFLLSPAEESLKKAISQIDKSAKYRLIHQNKAARLKSRLYKRWQQTSV